MLFQPGKCSGFVEVLTRIAFFDAQLAPSPRLAVSNLLRLMNNSGGRLKVLQAGGGRGRALRNFVFD